MAFGLGQAWTSLLGVIVLLKVDVLLVDTEVLETPKKVVVEDFDVKWTIHVAIDVYKSPKPR